MRPLTNVMMLASILSAGAIFGFFYAWVCSSMWGLDTADPRVAIAAMQAMNASVRNLAFAPAFFGTPFILGLTALLLFTQGQRRSAAALLAAALVYVCFGLLLTVTINVPMNEALATVTVPDDAATAGPIWQAYSSRWQAFNLIRTIASGVALLLAAAGLLLLDRRASPA